MKQEPLSFNELINAVKKEFARVKYKKERIERYESTWNKLRNYLEKRDSNTFDMKLGLDFLADEHGISVFKHLNTYKETIVRAVNMLAEYQLHGVVLSKKHQGAKEYCSVVNEVFVGFIESRRQRGFSERTLEIDELYLGRLSEYLASQSLENISELNAGHVLGFVNTLAGSTKATVYCTLCTVRVLLRYLYEEKILKKNFSYVVPKITIDKTSRIPSAYSKQDVQKLLDAIDRGNPKGKRDYAILLLASRLGMRAGDICRLSFQNIHWAHNEIVLVQGKTKEKIVLPLLPEVGSAIVNYLQYGRPITESATIFVRHTCPITPLVAPTLHSIVSQYMRLAGIHIPAGKKRGPHALRHSLASAMLEENIPLPVISEVLGHTSTDTTSIYLKININQLRRCALEIAGFSRNEQASGGVHHAL